MNELNQQLEKIVIDSEILDKLIEQSLSELKKDRDRDVIIKRHGISELDHQTLEQIGGELGITRERVRQIEKAALQRIRANRNHDNTLNQVVSLSLQQVGGIIDFENLRQELQLPDNSRDKLRFLIKVDPNFYFIDTNDSHDNIVLLGETYDANSMRALHNQFVDLIRSHGKPVKFEHIYKRIDGPHSQEAVSQLAQSSKLVAELDANWGLISWPEVNPRSIRDKVYIILKKAGRPMHFSEIARKIIEVKANPKKVTTQAVHNELIKDKRFILIGRGIYALAEWGYQAGTVADIIEEILREASPLSKEEIVKRVLARRQVKVSTIVLNLQEKDQFERVGKAIYRLKTRKS